MSKRTAKNLAQSLARILTMGGIERQYLTSALDQEVKLTGGRVGDILEGLVESMDSLNNKDLKAVLIEMQDQVLRPRVKREITVPGIKPLQGKVVYGEEDAKSQP